MFDMITLKSVNNPIVNHLDGNSITKYYNLLLTPKCTFVFKISLD